MQDMAVYQPYQINRTSLLFCGAQRAANYDDYTYLSGSKHGFIPSAYT